MNPANILMCVNIPKGITEDLITELFCVAGPIEEISISKSGRSCFIVYESEEAVSTAKELFSDLKLYGKTIELLSHNDIQTIHRNQKEDDERRKSEYLGNSSKRSRYDEDCRNNRSNQFHSQDSMVPTIKNDLINHRNDYYRLQPMYLASGDHSLIPPNRIGNNDKFLENDRIIEQIPESDVFRSPYSQPLSRDNFKNYSGGDLFKSNLPPTFARNFNDYNRRGSRGHSTHIHFEETGHSRSFNLDRNKSDYNIPTQISDNIYPIEDENIEREYEKSVRRKFHNSPKKFDRFRDDSDQRGSNFKNRPSTSSDYVKSKFKEFDRSPYSRPRDNKQSRSHYHTEKEYRNRRR